MKFIKENLRNDEIKEDCWFINLVFYKMFPNQEKIERKIIINVPKFDKIGLKANFNINNLKTFLKYIFPKCEVIDKQSVGNGHSDFIIKKDNEEAYIEVKKDNDSLRITQLNWFFENKDKEIYILQFNGDAEEYIKHKKEDTYLKTFESKEKEPEIDYAAYAKTLTY